MRSDALLGKCEAAFCVAVAVGLFLSLWLAAHRVALPYQLDYEEGNILNAAVLIRQGGTPYPPPSDSLCVFNPYGPVFYYSVAVLVKWFGVDFTYPRLLVVLSSLLVSSLLSLLLRRWTGSWKLGLAFGFLYLTFSVLRTSFFLLRVDLVGIALTLAGLYVFSELPRRSFLSVPLFVAAIFCKYTLVAAPGACFLFMLLRKQWRRAAWFAASTALLSTLAFVWVESATKGWFGFHMFWAHPEPFLLARYLWALWIFLVSYLALTLLTVVLAFYEFPQRAPSLALLYFGLCSITILTLGKVGTLENHMFEWLSALCLCAGRGYNCLRTRPREAATAAFASIALTISVALTLPRELGPDLKRAGCNQAYEYVKAYPGKRILSENVGSLVRSGRPVVMSNPFVYGQLVRSSNWPDGPLNSLIQSHSFDLIVLAGDIEYLRSKALEISPESRWPISFVNALEQNYRPVKHFACEDARVAFEPAFAIEKPSSFNPSEDRR
jgi:hypothetical protein